MKAKAERQKKCNRKNCVLCMRGANCPWRYDDFDSGEHDKKNCPIPHLSDKTGEWEKELNDLWETYAESGAYTKGEVHKFLADFVDRQLSRQREEIKNKIKKLLEHKPDCEYQWWKCNCERKYVTYEHILQALDKEDK